MVKKKRRPIAAGDRVWLLRDNPLTHGDRPAVTEGLVKFIERETAGSFKKRSYLKIYNCLEIHSKRQNVLADKDSIRPFTKQGKAELLRLLVNNLNLRAHHFRQLGNNLLDLAGVYLLEISELEGEHRGKAHRTK